MKAIQMHRFGGPEVLELVDAATPAPGPGRLLVRVGAAGINFAETLMRGNHYAVTPVLPAIPGCEVAGTVVALGEGVDGPPVGTRVAAPLFAGGSLFGGYAEYAVVDAGLAVPLPDTLSFDDATALMVQGLSALHLTQQASPRGKTVLVTAAAGGVGSMLVQLARRAGAATVIAAAGSDAKCDFVRSLGADVAVDYTRADWPQQVRAASGGDGPDIIYESTGGAITRNCLELLAPRGRLVVYGALNAHDFALGVPELLGLIFRNQSFSGFALVPLLTPKSLRDGLRTLFHLAERGELKVHLGGRYPLAHAGEAHAALEGRRTTGKLVLIP